ncbi:MAG: signal peptide peptidase SppA [Armatimonadota bacterium]|nr:signal peptide peptidase SppA [Armatimonadota bacterium]
METPRRSRWIIPTALIVGCLPWLILFTIGMVWFITKLAGLSGPVYSSDKIALVRISGVITAGQSSAGLFGGSTAGSERIVKQLEKARLDDSVKAILLRINSPGGSPAGSQEVYDEIMRIRKQGKVVVTSMGDVAASGGYYIASASDKIYANGSTITGSIGVIFETTDMSSLYKKIGIEPEVIKTGKYKDTGGGLRKLTPDERKLIRGIIDDTFDQFIRAVSVGRKMPRARVRQLADGRVFTGRQAKKIGLVDAIGGLQEAKAATARQAGIKGEPKVIEYEKDFWANLRGGAESESMRAAQRDEAIIRRLLQMAPELAP